jgi:nicotinamide riboside kinase
MNTIFVNLFGGPGTGKSTICASVFHKLKVMGIETEMALEYAKDVVWEESYKKLDNQIYIFGKQHYRVWRLSGKVQVVITDSPLLNSIVYDKTNNQFLKDLVIHEFKNLNTLNYYIDRDVDYNPNGRMQTMDQALQVDRNYLELLSTNDISYTRVPKGDSGVDIIVKQILEKINK